MTKAQLSDFAVALHDLPAGLFAFAVGMLVLVAAALYIQYVWQIRRDCPVIGRFRQISEIFRHVEPGAALQPALARKG